MIWNYKMKALLSWTIFLVKMTCIRAATSMSASSPNFSGSITNVTVPVGREAVLNCTVNDLGEYKVGWMKADDQTILSLNARVITHNPRISVNHDEKHYTWQLRIRQLKDSDAGCYMCQINTQSMKKQLGCVEVQVPPNIDDSLTSGDVNVNEGENVTLGCRAEGNPPPRIIWRREDGAKITIKHETHKLYKVDNIHGMQLTLERVDREQMGAYLCIASNDVPPAVSKRIVLGVNFPPSVRVSADANEFVEKTVLEIKCNVESFPLPEISWIKNKQKKINQSSKYSTAQITDGYRVKNSLTIKNITPNDVGDYTCLSKNLLGKGNSTFRLYEVLTTTTTTTTTESTTTTPTTTATTPTTEPSSTVSRTYQTTTTTMKSTTIVLEALVEHPLFRYLPSEELTTKSSSISVGSTATSTYCRSSINLLHCFTLLSSIFLLIYHT